MEKPILFNSEMVQAILQGRKTQTRRIIKFPKGMTGRLPEHGLDKSEEPYIFYPGGIKRPQYKIGNILWVREAWGNWAYDNPESNAIYYQYRADYLTGAKTYMHDKTHECDLPKWHPSIHMPRVAARIFLKVTDVRVQRLQDMYVDDAINEGAWGNGQPTLPFSLLYDEHPTASCNAVASFAHIWDSTIKKQDLDRYGWDANPWVWVIEFERMER